MTPAALLGPLALAASLSVSAQQQQQQQAPHKQLPLPGEVFALEGPTATHTAFVIAPAPELRKTPQPWVWYAPTLNNLPSKAETWMFERFLAAGIAIAGVDVGESYGSPAGVAVYDQLHASLVRERGFSPRPVLLARSRGGLRSSTPTRSPRSPASIRSATCAATQGSSARPGRSR